MTPSQHARSPLARLALAAGGIAALVAAAGGIYVADTLIGGLRGLAAGVLLACAVTAVCGLVFRETPRRPQVLTRPAPVRLPERDACEPVKTLT